MNVLGADFSLELCLFVKRLFVVPLIMHDHMAPRITSGIFIGFSFFLLILSSLICRRRLLLTALFLHRQKRECQQIFLVEDPVTCCWTGPYNQHVNTTNRILRDVVKLVLFRYK